MFLNILMLFEACQWGHSKYGKPKFWQHLWQQLYDSLKYEIMRLQTDNQLRTSFLN